MAYHQDMVDVPDWNGTTTSKILLRRRTSLLSKIFEEKIKTNISEKSYLRNQKKKMILRCIILLNKHTTVDDPPGRQQ